ncbi:hypothetical protein PSTG_13803 [Puccinia striiformis f. sp. tritici PST-78]|uniref:Uncharacterized protein n=1 Tax=Puccinia striiformis f. sp. tritici PST-78 TaxID=1165861 RepID=A0A0L0V0V7_9BASI|nr:hypothetical protein PSTG_13803 [Puccinia striiformis f. sp. tritici PST-78]
MGAMKEPLRAMGLEVGDQHTCNQRSCCGEPGSDEERKVVDINVIRNIIIGLSDGLTVPFGLTAGLSSLGSSRLVVVAGMAELISGAISMGVGGYLASEADRDQFRYRQRLVRKRVAQSCSTGMDRQVQDILQPFGISHGVCGMVSNDLLKFEYLRTTSAGQEKTPSSWKKSALVSTFLRIFSRNAPDYDAISQEKIMEEETVRLRGFESESLGLGMTEFLLKFGEGVEEVSTFQMYLAAFTIGSKGKWIYCKWCVKGNEFAPTNFTHPLLSFLWEPMESVVTPKKPVEDCQWREEITHSDVPRFWFTIDHIVKARKFLSTMVTCENSCIRLEIM